MLYECNPTKHHLLDFVSECLLTTATGFRSVAGFSPELATKAQRAGTITVLRDEPHYINHLFLEWDDHPADAHTAIEWLKGEDVAFKSYDSGGRSVHVEVPIVPLHGRDAAYSCRVFSKQFTNVDNSFLHYAGLFRLPGTTHEKTGRKKTLNEVFKGHQMLEIPTAAKPGLKFTTGALDVESFSNYLTYYQSYISNGPAEGRRYRTIFALSSNFREAGLSFEASLELMSVLNNTWTHKHSEHEVTRSVKDAYSKT